MSVRHARGGRLPSPSFQLKQFSRLVELRHLSENIRSFTGQIVVSCNCCNWEARRPSKTPAWMQRKATVADRRRAVDHFLRYHRDRLPNGFRVEQ